MTDRTRQLPSIPLEDVDRLVLERMPFAAQLAAVLRGEYTSADWRAIHTAAERFELLCGLGGELQFDALRARCFSLEEWCAFARRYPQRVLVLNGEFAFITVTTPEWCER